MKRTLLSLSAVLLTPLAAPAQDLAEREAALSEYVSRLTGEASAEKLREWHDRLASAPHDAGTPGDKLVVETLAELFESFGLEVTKQELEVYIGRPVAGEVWVVEPDLVKLETRERALEEDPYTQNEAARAGWNGYAGSGDVTAGVVYANYGRLQDFERLEAMGVSCAGKIVVARYGGNFRGYKAKYAEAAGAVGLIIYTDPADSGYARGAMYPEGGYANETSIQRGSLKTLAYAGDPLTPGRPAFPGADRMDPDELEGLPTIPVQPIGWGAASELRSRMPGGEAPTGWAGALDLPYRLTGGEGLKVRLKVEQARELTRTWNVIGTLRGSERPDELVIIGCHHDAWGFGAGDPACGMIAVVEAARVFGELAKGGWRPERSILFAGWGAEEHGIIGSTEFVENARDVLTQRCVAYINLDAAAMGPNFNASASPSLWTVVEEAAGETPNCGDGERTVLEAWLERSEDGRRAGHPRIGELGGGSDHVGFLCHACVPSVSLSSGGAPGVAYHSLYDTLAWYRRIVGDDYEPALMITRMAASIAARLGDTDAALDPANYGGEIIRKVESFAGRIDREGLFGGADREEIERAHERVRAAALFFEGKARDLRAFRRERTVGEREMLRITTMLRAIDMRWCEGDGMQDDRAWFRSLYAAPDATSGYASWTLPGPQHALHTNDGARYVRELDQLAQMLEDNGRALDQMLGALDP
ncbi:MAG: M28 family peptidase [Phycisphaerales bacterium JB059]